MAFGIDATRKLSVDAFPDVTNIQVQVATEVPGRSPDEVERIVTVPLEIGMTGLPGLTEMRSLNSTLSPVLSSYFLQGGHEHETLMVRAMKKPYIAILKWATYNEKATIAAALAMLLRYCFYSRTSERHSCLNCRRARFRPTRVRVDVAVKIFGDDLNVLIERAQQVARVAAYIRGTGDIKVDRISGQQNLNIAIDYQAIARYELNVSDVNDVIEAAIR